MFSEHNNSINLLFINTRSNVHEIIDRPIGCREKEDIFEVLILENVVFDTVAGYFI